MDVVFNVCKTNSNVQVLSAPNIVTTHNREASIIVGSREPVVTTAVTGTSSSDSSDMVANIDYEDVALELTVKPLIGSNGIIQMEITQKINEVTSRVTLAGLGQQPVIGTRQASSFVSVGNGRMVVLGGLQKLKDTNNDDKVFILGDIPLLGRLFRPSNTEVARTELLIFIRPIVITTTEEADADARSKLGQIAPSSRVQNYLDNGSFIEPADDEQQEDSPTADRPARPRAMGRK
jgi:general secretion pathway protein D